MPGRTVDRMFAVSEVNHPKLAMRKSVYMEKSRKRHGAGLVSDDAKTLRQTQDAAAGERAPAP